MICSKALFAAAVALVAVAASAHADGRAPTADEQAAIGDALKTQGFSSWSTVELDDGKWEIDNAVHADGKVYDVDLKLGDLSMIKKEIED